MLNYSTDIAKKVQQLKKLRFLGLLEKPDDRQARRNALIYIAGNIKTFGDACALFNYSDSEFRWKAVEAMKDKFKDNPEAWMLFDLHFAMESEKFEKFLGQQTDDVRAMKNEFPVISQNTHLCAKDRKRGKNISYVLFDTLTMADPDENVY